MKKRIYREAKEIDIQGLKIICFEGGDYSGKSTQARKFAESFSRDNKIVMLVHFPRVGKLVRQLHSPYNIDDLDLMETTENTKRVYAETSKVLYNDKFWDKYNDCCEKLFLIENMNDVPKLKHDKKFSRSDYETLRKVCTSNISCNYIDKQKFLDSLTLRPDARGVLPFYPLTDDYTFFENGIEIGGTEDMLRVSRGFFDRSPTMDKERIIVLDRFMLSGYIYNFFVPAMQLVQNGVVDMINRLRTKHCWTPTNFNEQRVMKFDAVDMLKYILTEYTVDKCPTMSSFIEPINDLLVNMYKLQRECDKRLVDSLNRLLDDETVFYDYESLDKHLNSEMISDRPAANIAWRGNTKTISPRYMTIVFRTTPKYAIKIRKASEKSNRKNDAYDEDTFMQKCVHGFIESLWADVNQYESTLGLFDSIVTHGTKPDTERYGAPSRRIRSLMSFVDVESESGESRDVEKRIIRVANYIHVLFTMVYNRFFNNDFTTYQYTRYVLY